MADLKRRDELFPNTILNYKYKGSYESIIFPLGDILWEEYSACRESAILAAQETARYEKTLLDVLSVAKDRADTAIKEYRQHGNIHRIIAEAGNPLCEPLRMASYLLGHLDGLNQDIDQLPITNAAIVEGPYALLIERQSDLLRDLWDRRQHWKSLDKFQPLRDLCIDALAGGGMYFFQLPDGKCYVDIP